MLERIDNAFNTETAEEVPACRLIENLSQK